MKDITRVVVFPANYMAHVLTNNSASEMTYIVSSGALNSTHSLTY